MIWVEYDDERDFWVQCSPVPTVIPDKLSEQDSFDELEEFDEEVLDIPIPLP